jgi:predicted amidohydrolase
MAASLTIRAGAAQLPAVPLTRHADAWPLICDAVTRAAAKQLDLLVLPECAYPAYYLESAAAYRAAGVERGEVFVEKLCELARTHGLHLICGFVDDRDGRLFNSAVVIDAAGRECGRCDKSFLWGADNDYFSPGERIAPIDTPLGKIGVVICADGRAPEIAAGLTAAGARLIAVPTCWVNVAREPGEYHNAQAEFMIAGRAIECRVPIVAANKFGAETAALSYCGMSVICDRRGNVLAQAPPNDPALIDAEVKLAPPPRVTVPEWAQRRIFSRHPALTPDADMLGAVRIAVAPKSRVLPLADDDNGRDELERLADAGVQVVATSLPETDEAERLEIYGRALGMAVVCFPYVERLMLEQFGAFGCVASDHVYSFVPTRFMALDGASIVFVTGKEVPVPLLRTRAVENRIFVAAADDDSAILIDPAGAIIGHAPSGSGEHIIADIDLRITANKVVFPKTHIWAQRRPHAYARAFSVSIQSAW